MKLSSILAPLAALPIALSVLAAPSDAQAFCGFYVAGADTKLFNNATMVVLMREGTRTVLSMANNYQGPPQDFAMVVPVPVVLQKENVKTLPVAIFDKIDKLASPRLVEYWEQDPCAPPVEYKDGVGPKKPMVRMMGGGVRDEESLGVKVEARFEVGEYEVVILSANDSMGLDTWIRQNGYKIPAGAEPLLRPYVLGGSKFFVAKVNVQKVRFENGMAQLSPLRFHYDTETFNLPVRLGLVNSGGTQDLIVHILAKGQRYETANYKNVAIPTNLDVKDSVRKEFGSFYAALFDRTLARHPKSVITEYAWDASTCDPCPGPTLDGSDFMTLGADVLVPVQKPSGDNDFEGPVPGRRWGSRGYVLTRMHMRYDKDVLGEDLVFRAAPPIVGGREFVTDEQGQLEHGAKTGSVNNFQARYAIRHAWTGPIKCKSPQRGVWGGPPGGGGGEGKPRAEAAQKLAFVKREGIALAGFVQKDGEETAIDSGPLISVPMPVGTGDAPPSPSGTASGAGSSNGAQPPPGVPPEGGGCAGCHVGAESKDWGWAAMALSALGMWLGRRRNQTSIH